MKTVIFKYELKVTDHQTIQVPSGSIPLCVQVQRGVPCIWIQINKQGITKDFQIRIVGTGHPFDDGPLEYLSTFQLGELVFHAYWNVNFHVDM